MGFDNKYKYNYESHDYMLVYSKSFKIPHKQYISMIMSVA